MITQLTLRNFALFTDISVDINTALTVITGETGAGKSLLMDALHFLLGKKLTLPHSSESEPVCVTAVCSRALDPFVFAALGPEQAKTHQENPPSCWTITRTLSPQGRSKAIINATTLTTKQLQQITSACIHIHAQHAHLDFCKESHQRHCLDRYGNHTPTLAPVAEAFAAMQSLLQRKNHIEAALLQTRTPEELHSILDDLATLDLAQLDLEDLSQRHRQLQNRQSYLQTCQQSLQALQSSDNTSVPDTLYQTQKSLQGHCTVYPELEPIVSLLAEAETLAQEAAQQLNQIVDCDYSLDQANLQQLDSQLSDIYKIARKYRIEPASLADFHEDIHAQYQKHQALSEELSHLSAAITTAQSAYETACLRLHEQRCHTAEKLAAYVSQQLPSLNLPYARFMISCRSVPEQPRADGTCQIRFHFSANPGQNLAFLGDGASGGELARLALVLQTSCTPAHPTLMVFDEADVGVSGKTASLVGRLLGAMAEKNPVLCITHSPQVAACGNIHWHIVKNQSHNHTETSLQVLDQASHIQEVARLLSGDTITPETLANAEQLCQAQRSPALQD
jgi:DNA repair protein RecN (Recombination protein N)